MTRKEKQALLRQKYQEIRELRNGKAKPEPQKRGRKKKDSEAES